MLWFLARIDTPEAVDIAAEVVRYVCVRGRNFCEELVIIRDDQTSWVDSTLLKNLGISMGEMMDGLRYEILFRRLCAPEKLERTMLKYAARTISAIEGAKGRHEVAVKTQYKHKKRRR